MEKKIELINKSHIIKFPVLISYNIDQNDKYIFSLKMKGEKNKEYAVLFVNHDGTYYTAEIIGSSDWEKIFSVLKLKIANCEEIRIVDIETEQIVFKADFKTTSVQNEEICSPDPNISSADTLRIEIDIPIAENDISDTDIPVDELSESVLIKEPKVILLGTFEPTVIEAEEIIETTQINDVPIIMIKSEPKVKAMGFVIEEKPELEEIIPEEINVTNTQNEIEFFPDYEKDSSQSSILIEEDEDLYDVDLFMKEIAKPDVSKIQKASLINDNEGILDDIFNKFESFETPLKNHEFYELDETNAKKSSLKIILNGFIVPMLSPFLEYQQNPFGSSGNYPKYLIGKTTINGETEYYVYGTLGRNLREEQPFSGATGFVYFEKIKDSDEGFC